MSTESKRIEEAILQGFREELQKICEEESEKAAEAVRKRARKLAVDVALSASRHFSIQTSTDRIIIEVKT